MQITVDSDAGLDDFVELLEEVGAWLSSRGILQWPEGSNRAQATMLRSQVRSGALLSLRDNTGTLVGGCVLCIEPYDVWREHPGEATYLHKLVVARSIGGLGWGAQIMKQAEGWTLGRGSELLRLDCWEGNEVLRSYYRELGFTELDVVTEGSYEVRLFEKRLGKHAAGGQS